jgi:hypothetical protein
MTEQSISQRRKVTKVALGNAAVDGLLSGLLAGLAMAVYLGAAALAMGERLAVMFSRFTVTAGDSPVSGFLLHLAVSGIYGLVFGFVCRLVCRWPRLVWLVGVAYGGLLWLLATLILLPSTRMPPRSWRATTQTTSAATSTAGCKTWASYSPARWCAPPLTAPRPATSSFARPRRRPAAGCTA